jgi:hypothetical protein
MSLFDDLRDLDLTEVTTARAGISVSVSGDDVRAVIEGGAITSALGDLGTELAAVSAALDDPALLMAPLLAVFTDLTRGLDGEGLPVAELATAVAEGVGVLSTVLSGLADDPLAAGGVLGRALPDALSTVTRAAGGYELVGLEGLGQFGALVARVEDGGPLDPAALAELAVDVLAPFPRATLDGLRASVDAMLTATAGIGLPTTRTQGLVVRLDAVAAAAKAGDAAAVGRALAELDQVRAQTVQVIRTDLATVTSALDRLPVTGITGALTSAGNVLAGAEEGILELLDGWRADVASARAIVEGIDPAELIAQLDALVDRLEGFLREQFEQPITAAAGLVAEKVHELFAHIPIRPVREAVRAALHAAAKAITDADLDRPAEEVRAVLGKLREVIAVADLGERIRAAITSVMTTLHTALDGVIAALAGVKAAIETVAGTAADVLGRAVAAVTAFQSAVTTVTGTMDALDLSSAAGEVVAKVRQIREAVEGVVSQVPLPEPVRPLIGQLIDQLEALDFGGDPADNPIFKPILDAVGGLALSESLGTVVHEGLSALRDAVANVVPASLIDGIQQEVQHALDVVAGFDPATLLAGVTEQIDGIADTVAGIDITAIGATAHAPFQQLMDGWDRLRPSTLLAPVSQAYRSALSGIPMPAPEAAINTVGGQVNAGGDAAGQSATAPLARLVPGATTTPAGAPATPAPTPGDDVVDLRPGDVVRLFGYLPAKLREALHALEAGPAGDALAAIDRLVGALATDLRRVATAVAEIEARLDAGLDALTGPLGPAHARAQIALQANFSTGELDLSAALTGVNQCGPGTFRAELTVHTGETRARVAETGARHASVAARLLAVADGLDRCPLAQLTGGVDTLLAALDPEPLAVEVDELVFAVIRKAPTLVTGVETELRAVVDRARAMLGALNPAALGQRVLRAAIDALYEELSVLDPRLLGAELDEIHQAISASLAAYDPAKLAEELTAVQGDIVAALRGLDPAVLLGDLTAELTALVTKAAGAVPTDVLSGLPQQLTDLDEAFAGIDLDVLLDRVANLAPEVVGAFGQALDGVRTEIVALLSSLRYATGRIEASVEVTT